VDPLPAADWDRSGAVGVSYVRIVSRGIGHIQGSIDGCWRRRVSWRGIALRTGVYCIPRLGTCRQEICSGHQRRQLIAALIVSHGNAEAMNLIYAGAVIVDIDCHHGAANWIAGLVEDFSG